MSDDAPTPAGDGGRDGWPAPASDEAVGPQNPPSEVSLDKGAAPAAVHDRRTATSLPGVTPPPAPDGVPQAWAAPVAPPVNGSLGAYPPPNPFAPPVAHTGAVPPPPIAPDGPGQVPYGYPAPGQGGYYQSGYSQGGYYWPGGLGVYYLRGNYLG